MHRPDKTSIMGGEIDQLLSILDDDLIETSSHGGDGRGNSSKNAELNFDTSHLQPPAAADFSNARLTEELEARKIRPTGFRDQDISTLQKVLNEEFEVEKEHFIRQHRDMKEQAVKQAGLQRRRAMLEKQLAEERSEIDKDPNIAFWLGLIKKDGTPATARIEVNSITARALAKAMWTNSSLTSLDLSRNNIDDFGGAYIAKLLKRNSSLVKLELDCNGLGSMSCRALAESLAVNTTLKHLSLEANQLTAGGKDGGGFSMLTQVLKQNTSITGLNFWRCDLGLEAGNELAAGIEGNTTITFLDIGGNGFSVDSQRRIAEALERNGKIYAAQQAARKAEQEEKDRITAAEKRVQEQLRKERDLREWLSSQINQRAEERRESEEKKFAEAKEESMERARLQQAKAEAIKKAADEAAAKKKRKAKKK